MGNMILLSLWAISLLLLSFFPVCLAFVVWSPPPLQAKARLPYYYPRHDDRSAVRYTNGQDDDEEEERIIISPLVIFPRMCHASLDLNGDGKIDEQDLKVLQQRIVQCLDVNGDGHSLDEKNAMHVVHVVILLSWTLSATPAVAKGGGHGGGGGGHSSSSHHSSVHYSTSHGRAGQSHYDDSREYYYRTWWYGRNSKYDKPWNPAACRELPGEGERIMVLSSPSLFSNRHDPAIVTAVDEATCSFSVQRIQDNLNDDDAFATQHFRTPRNWEDDIFECVFFSSLSLFALFGVNAVDMACFQAKNAWFDKRFVARQATSMEDEDFSSSQANPTSGRYVGTSRESDGANQDIRVKLHFDEETRKIHGSGYDSDDGAYFVEGDWARQMVKWKETYHRHGGFTVDVRGNWNEDASEMDGWFVSSRGICGTFVLGKKKKWGLMMIRSNEHRRL